MALLTPKEGLQRAPSRDDGVDPETEEQLRIFGAELIQRAGTLLRVNQMTIVSASALFQHFFFRRSFAEFDVQAIATAAMVLGCKLEEDHRRLHEVVVVFHRLRMRELHESGKPSYDGVPTPGLEGQQYLEAKQEVVRGERHILREIGFEVELLFDHPHKYILQYLKSLVPASSNAFSQKAWNYMNDSMRTVLCCTHEPRVIAAAGVLLAAQAVGIELPTNPPWWEALDLTDVSDVRHIAGTIAALYKRAPAQYISVHKRRVQTWTCDPATPYAETPGPEEEDACFELDGGGIPRKDGGGNLDDGRIGEMLAERATGGSSAVELVSMAPPPPPALSRHPPVKVSGFDRRGGGEERRRGARDDIEKERERGKDHDRRKENHRGREKSRETERERQREKERERERERERDKHRKGREKRHWSGSSGNSRSGSCGRSSRSDDRKGKTGRVKSKDRRIRQRATSSEASSGSADSSRAKKRTHVVDNCSL